MIGEGSMLEAEIVALKTGLDYCVENIFPPITLETDCLSLKKELDEIWELPQ